MVQEKAAVGVCSPWDDLDFRAEANSRTKLTIGFRVLTIGGVEGEGFKLLMVGRLSQKGEEARE